MKGRALSLKLSLLSLSLSLGTMSHISQLCTHTHKHYKPLHAIAEYIFAQYSTQDRKLKILYAETLKMSLVIR